MFNRRPREICLNYNIYEEKGYECYSICKRIKIKECEKLLPSPHVCNGCNNKRNCNHVKLYYKTNISESEYKK